MKKDPNKYPKGWTRDVVEGIVRRVETQTDDEAIVEADAAWENQHLVLMRVPTELANRVRALIDRHQSTIVSERKTRTRTNASKRGKRAA